MAWCGGERETSDATLPDSVTSGVASDASLRGSGARAGAGGGGSLPLPVFPAIPPPPTPTRVGCGALQFIKVRYGGKRAPRQIRFRVGGARGRYGMELRGASRGEANEKHIAGWIE